MPASNARHFADRYGASRKIFLDAAKGEGAALESHQNPHANGPRDEPLYTDVARIGPPPGEAARVLVVTSGVHGVEGFAGSGLQVFTLREELYKAMPRDMALVLIHGVNPYGFAHARRVTEGNVDLNRNFLDHDGPYPDDSAYDAVRDIVAPGDLEPNKVARDERVRAFVSAHGQRAWQAAVTGGQWRHADGLFYGGRAPVWSNTLLRSVCAAHAAGARAVAHLDLHTGLGPYGHGEVIASARPDLGGGHVADWYGSETTTLLGDTASVSAPLNGVVFDLWTDQAKTSDVTTACLEFGTRDFRTVLDALARDNWLYLHGEVDSAQGHEIKSAVTDALYPDEIGWKDMLCVRMGEVVEQTITGLGTRG
ncbi:MAG: DUF2817 domain-containing protein [Alphaproteobacteria bacterium]